MTSLVEYDNAGAAYFIFTLPDDPMSTFPIRHEGKKELKPFARIINLCILNRTLKDGGEYVIKINNDGTWFRSPTWELRTVYS